MLRIEARGDWEAQWVAGFLSGFHLVETATPADSRSALTLRVERATPPVVPSGMQGFEINHGVCQTDGQQYFLTVDGSLVRIGEPKGRLVDVWFGLTSHARHPIALVNVFSYALQAALRRVGVYDLHAASAVDPSAGNGALFVGASGSGKTTLTLRLIECGWRYVSDDMVVMRETPAGVEVEGLRRLFAVAPMSLVGVSGERLSAALGQPVASDQSKRTLDPQVVFPDRRAVHCLPRLLFFPRITAEPETTIALLPARGAMQQLLRHCPWATYDVHSAPDYLRMLARLANQCRAYELLGGRDLLLQPNRTADLLAPYMRE
ncbi:MAG: hypothetical protein ABJB97_01310 [Acidobacteriota bacterium]